MKSRPAGRLPLCFRGIEGQTEDVPQVPESERMQVEHLKGVIRPRFAALRPSRSERDGVVLQRTPAKRMFAASELSSASLASWDILFPALAAGRNGAERGPSRSFIRTTVTRSEAHFGPFPVSLRPLSLTQ